MSVHVLVVDQDVECQVGIRVQRRLERQAAARDERIDALAELRAAIEIGVRQLDAGEGKELDIEEVKQRIEKIKPDFLVIPTAPSYLFWRCPPPELRVPQQWFHALECGAIKVAIGPHASATPASTLRKLNCDVAFRGEPDQVLPKLAHEPWSQIDGCCWKSSEGQHMSPSLAVKKTPPRTTERASPILPTACARWVFRISFQRFTPTLATKA